MNMKEPWACDELATTATPQTSRRWVARIALGAALLAFVAVIAFSAYELMKDSKPAKRQVVQISLLKPPPPAPPPPPEQKPPEPEVKEEVKLEQPVPQPAEQEAPPAGEQLGLDTDGSGNGDGFGLAAKKGGRDITTIGGGSNRAQFAWFTGQVQTSLQEQLSKNEKLRHADYRAILKVWFADDGSIERYELVGSSGNRDVDQNIKLSLQEMPPLKQAPPHDLPQPVRLRVTSRGAG